MKQLVLAVAGGALPLPNSDLARCGADAVFRDGPNVPNDSINRVWITA